MDNSSIGGSWKGYNPPPAAAAASVVDTAGETDGISVLPPEILSQVFTLLGNDIQSAALVCRSWNAIVIDNVKRKEINLLQSYSKFLADNLDGEKHPLEKKELLRLSEDNQILNCDSLGEIKIFLLKVRSNIESLLSKLDQNDFNKLRELTKNENMPIFFKIIFDYVVIAKALNEAILEQNPLLKLCALQLICKRLVELGELDKALDVARAIRVGKYADEMLANICRKFVERGFFEKAIEIASTIQSFYVKWTSFKEICWSLTQANKVDRAMEVAGNLDTKYLRSFAFWGICLSLNSSKQFVKAIAVAHRIEEVDLREVVLQGIHNGLFYSGKLERINRLVERSHRLAWKPIGIRLFLLERIRFLLEEQERIDNSIKVPFSILNASARDSLLRQVLEISYAKSDRNIELSILMTVWQEYEKQDAMVRISYLNKC